VQSDVKDSAAVAASIEHAERDIDDEEVRQQRQKSLAAELKAVAGLQDKVGRNHRTMLIDAVLLTLW
jgi:hypothetical protein